MPRYIRFIHIHPSYKQRFAIYISCIFHPGINSILLSHIQCRSIKLFIINREAPILCLIYGHNDTFFPNHSILPVDPCPCMTPFLSPESSCLPSASPPVLYYLWWLQLNDEIIKNMKNNQLSIENSCSQFHLLEPYTLNYIEVFDDSMRVQMLSYNILIQGALVKRGISSSVGFRRLR